MPASPKVLLASILGVLTVFFSGSVTAQTVAPESRIAPNADLTPTTRLSGHLPRWVATAPDLGAAPDDTAVRLTFVLTRPTASQTAFEQMLVDQQNPASARYHQWLTPGQVGEQFGPSMDDVAAVTQWLGNHGFQVLSVSPSRTFIQTAGTTGAAAAALGTTFHNFSLGGETRLSATTEPAIPSAFSVAVKLIDGLTEVPLRPYHAIQQAQPRPSADAPKPLYSGSSNTVHYIFPGDFARIYDTTATTTAGYTGTGVKVAIIGRSQITASDITELEGLAGLPSKVHNVVLVPGSPNPGLVSGDEDESTLDVGRVLTIAPGAQADLVIAASASGGISAAIQYNINTLGDPVMSVSYGACEQAAGQSNVNFYDNLFQIGALEGISTFISSGDSAAAGCSKSFTTPTGSEFAAMGNYLCASSYVTCLGGTEFSDASSYGSYWSPTNSSTYTSAFGYIPEGAWNEPSSVNSSGVTVYEIGGSGGGPSAYITKPTWQATATNNPHDGARDTPDIAFSASGHDGYFACLAYKGAGYDCNQNGGVIFSGTSAAAPDMAAIAAILDQRLGKALGNLNPTLYAVALSTPSAFHDATPATSGVATCDVTTASMCNNTPPGVSSLKGAFSGSPLQVGYDEVTGLGSLDVTNFVNAVVAGASLLGSTTTVTANPTTIAAGKTVVFTAIVSGSGTPAVSGTVQFYSNGAALGSPVTVASGTASTPATAFATAGTYSITATYSGDTTYAGSTSAAISFVVTIPSTTTTVTAVPTTIPVGRTAVFTATVAITGSTAATGTVQFYSNGVALGSAVALSGGQASTPATTFATAGTFSITATYAGDSNNATSISPAISFVVTPLPTTTTTVTASPTTIIAGKTAVFTAVVGITSGTAATGTVTFYSNGVALGSPVTVSGGQASTPATTFATAGTFSITASYSGDNNNAPSTSSALSFVVAPLPATTTVVTAIPTTIIAGKTAVFKAVVSITSGTAAAGTVTFYSNGVALGAPVTLSGGQASTPATTFANAGTFAITATYSGDSNNATSTSSALSFVVAPLPSTTTTVTAAPTTIIVGHSAMFTATVAITSSTAATGTVQFYNNGTVLGGPVPLTGTTASTPATVFSTAGTYAITAIYSGDTNNAASTSAALNFVVAPLPATTTVVAAAPPSPIIAGNSAVFSATVAGTGGFTPTGTVAFNVNGTIYTASLTASTAFTAAIQFPAAGTYSVIASYSGDTNNAASISPALNFVVSPATAQGLTIAASPTTLSVTAGATSGNTSSITLNTTNSYYGSIALACAVTYTGGSATLPPSCSFAPAPVSFSGGTTGSSVMTITTTAPHAITGQFSMLRRVGGISLGALLLLLIPARRRRSIRLATLLPLFLLGAGLMVVTGCGSGGSPVTPVGTSKGSYTVTVTATPGVGTAANTSVALTVN